MIGFVNPRKVRVFTENQVNGVLLGHKFIDSTWIDSVIEVYEEESLFFKLSLLWYFNEPQIQETTAVSAQLEAQLLQVWENSVYATHDFLRDAEIKNIKQYVPQALHNVEHLIVAYVDEMPVGFMGVNGQMLEMLFVDASQCGHGIGKALINDGLKHYQIRR